MLVGVPGLLSPLGEYFHSYSLSSTDAHKFNEMNKNIKHMQYPQVLS